MKYEVPKVYFPRQTAKLMCSTLVVPDSKEKIFNDVGDPDARRCSPAAPPWIKISVIHLQESNTPKTRNTFCIMNRLIFASRGA